MNLKQGLERSFRLRPCWASIFILSILLPMPLQAAEAFYVDPDWDGAAQGTATRPWTRLKAAEWQKINNALRNDDVIVYFSAREAGSDRNETTTQKINVARENTGNWLTLDGKSKYNANDSSPNWKSYGGASRFQISSDTCIRVNTGDAVPQSKFVIRGFRLVAGSGGTEGSSVKIWGGSDIIVEQVEATHASGATGGPGIHYMPAIKQNRSTSPCVASPLHNCGGFRNITIRNNTVHNTYGEGIYFGGSSGLDFRAQSHVTIENNVIYDVATRGGEGDGIDMKDANSNVVIRNNTIYRSSPGTGRDGIHSASGALIEGNFIRYYGRSGIALSVTWNDYKGGRSNSIVRNNIIVGTGGSSSYSNHNGIRAAGSNEGDQWTNLQITNNTIYDVRGRWSIGIFIAPQAGVSALHNNLVANIGNFCLQAGPQSLSNHSNNLFYRPEPGVRILKIGSVRYTASDLAQFDRNSLSVDPAFRFNGSSSEPSYFDLDNGSPALDAGKPIDSQQTDFFGNARPRGRGWDIGAIESRSSGGARPSPPSGLRPANNDPSL